MRFIIIRHGETIENAKRILTGHLPGKLSNKGKKQAQRLALRLRREHIYRIYSSDLKRAVDTTKAIARYHKALIIYTKELREQNYGIYQGRTLEEFLTKHKNDRTFKSDGEESLYELRRRVKKFLIKLEEDRELSSKTVLVSTHAGVARSIFSILTNVPIREAIRIKSRNAGVLVFEGNRNRLRLVKDTMSAYH